MNTDMFRFVSVRPPQRSDRSTISVDFVYTHPPSEDATPLVNALRAAREAGDARGRMTQLARDFVASSEFLAQDDPTATPLARFDGWLTGRGNDVDLTVMNDGVTRAFERPAQSVVGEPYLRLRRRASDSLLAASIYRGAWRSRHRLVRWLRLVRLIERIGANDAALSRPAGIRNALAAVVLLPAALFPVPSVESADAPARGEGEAPADPSTIETDPQDLARLKTAHEEVMAALRAERQAATEGASARRPSREPVRSDADQSAPPRAHPATGAARMRVSLLASAGASAHASLVLSERAAGRLSAGTVALLDQLGMPAATSSIPEVADRITDEIAAVGARLHSAARRSTIIRIGGTYLPGDELFDTGTHNPRVPGPCPPGFIEPPEPTAPPVPQGAGSVRALGMADLMVAEQEIRRYEMGEVAHIENVLQGEGKERRHRRTRTTEETFQTETERTEETERDLQTTERFELQQESQQVIGQDTSRDVGVTASGSYGPSLDVTLSSNFATQSSREETTRSATSYARDVTARAASRLRQRVLERRFRRRVEEIEEINTHTLNNTAGTGSVIGVYRWVDKVYRAQVVNYGRRMLLEFVVPDPAAFVRHALSARPVEQAALVKPQPPGYCVAGRFTPLTAEDVAPENYRFWASQYGATNIEPPPAQFQMLGAAIPQSDMQEGVGALAFREIEVPVGYVATWATCTHPVLPGLVQGPADGSQQVFNVYIDDQLVTDPIWLSREVNIVPVSIILVNVLAYAINVLVLCMRTAEAYQRWQLATYATIVTAYNELRSRYDEQLAAIRLEDGVALAGRNPLLNREIERTELKKLALELLTGQRFDLFDAMRRNVPPHGYPELDLSEAEHEGRYIQFFEQSLEWVNMTYVFYPYFWGQKGDWRQLALLDDPDALFGRFLQAGAARIQLPVRPGYEDVLMHFVASGGEIWDGGDPPLVDDDLYVSILDEIREQQGQADERTQGTISVTQGSVGVLGSATDFLGTDVDRRITILGEQYRIAVVSSPTSLTLTEPYRGDTAQGVAYSIGVRLVGGPWEVRVPTSLVILQPDAALPDWSAGGRP